VVYDDDAGESAVADTMATDDKIPAKLQERDLHRREGETRADVPPTPSLASRSKCFAAPGHRAVQFKRNIIR
jgi:hypothetical protein